MQAKRWKNYQNSRVISRISNWQPDGCDPAGYARKVKKVARLLLLMLVPAMVLGAQSTDSTLPMLEVVRVFPALTFERPVFLTHAGDDSGLLYVIEQAGVIHRLDPDSPGQSEVFLDIRARVNRGGNEEGLLGLAFSPTFVENGHFYVYYSAASPRRSVLSRFTTGADGLGDEGSEEVILEVGQPFRNHNGGMITFGPDGMLYIGLGDGGSAGDPRRNGQNLGSLLGTILRIDTEQPQENAPYGIPADNPFVGQPGARGEIWAYGLRNPWRFSFDRETGVLWVGDVGQNALEEVDIVHPGANYGWNVMEGSRCFRSPSCDGDGFQAPVTEYGRNLGCSITGGYVYRGQRIPALEGVYLYADFCSGRVWGLRHDGAAVTAQAELARAPFEIPSFGEDADGELYVLGFDGGIYTLVGAPGQEPREVAPTPSPEPTVAPKIPTTTPPAVGTSIRPESTPTSGPVLGPAPTPTAALRAQDQSIPINGWWLALAVAATLVVVAGLVYLMLRARNPGKRG